jgi:hypothetical protein
MQKKKKRIEREKEGKNSLNIMEQQQKNIYI